MASETSALVRTMCPMNCHPTLCGMLAEVRGGKLVGVRGDEENPDSRGFLCVRGKASRDVIGNPRRLLQPLLRDRRGEGDWRLGHPIPSRSGAAATRHQPAPAAQIPLQRDTENMPEFQKAFGCKSGDAMVRAADQRCKLW